jgi:hypothetical protein
MIFEKFKNLGRDRTVKATIGMSREKFDALVPAFADAYDRILQERLQSKRMKRLPRGGPKGVLDTAEKRLFFVLYYLKTYPTFDVLGFHFDLSAGHAHDYVVEYMEVLRRALETLEVAPERTADSLDNFLAIIEKYDELLVDATEVACVRPADNDAQKARYSGKKTPHPQDAGDRRCASSHSLS